MTKLWLTYRNEKGAAERVLVDREKFAVGRHSENDLSFVDSVISRQHLKIERFADVFIVSDAGSSYGTTLNGAELTEPVALRHGDKLKLGGRIEIEIELISDEAAADEEETAGGAAAETGAASSAASSGASARPTGGASIFGSLFFIAPLFALLILTFLGGILFVFTGNSKNETAEEKGADFVYSTDRRKDVPENAEKNKVSPPPEPLPAASNNDDLTANSSAEPVPTPSGEMDKIERHSAQFLRRIATRDPNAFLTSKQQAILKNKIDQIKTSPALADNFASARRQAAAIEMLAKAKNLTPRFLATAALARLGAERGDVLATAQNLAGTLDDLTIVFGNELSDDSLLVIAFYEQGAAGRTLAMRDMVANLTKQFPAASSRQIRSIWFLKENGKISDAEFDRALRFLAIGTISQHPKDFGISADAVSFE